VKDEEAQNASVAGFSGHYLHVAFSEQLKN
jgi:hypothetical protein